MSSSVFQANPSLVSGDFIFKLEGNQEYTYLKSAEDPTCKELLTGNFVAINLEELTKRFTKEDLAMMVRSIPAYAENLIRLRTGYYIDEGTVYALPKDNLPSSRHNSLIKSELERFPSPVMAVLQQRVRLGDFVQEHLAKNPHQNTAPTPKVTIGNHNDDDDEDLPQAGSAVSSSSSGKSPFPSSSSFKTAPPPAKAATSVAPAAAAGGGVKSEKVKDDKHNNNGKDALSLFSAWSGVGAVTTVNKNDVTFASRFQQLEEAEKARIRSSKKVGDETANPITLITKIRKLERQAAKEMDRHDEVSVETRTALADAKRLLKLHYMKSEIEIREDDQWYDKRTGKPLKSAMFAANVLELACAEGTGQRRSDEIRRVNMFFFLKKTSQGKNVAAAALEREQFISASGAGKTRESKDAKNMNYEYVVYDYEDVRIPVAVVHLTYTAIGMLVPRVGERQAREAVDDVNERIQHLLYLFGKKVAAERPRDPEAANDYQRVVDSVSARPAAPNSAASQLVDMFHRFDMNS